MKAGNIETAPPKSTANISIDCAPRMISLLNTKRNPPAMLVNIGVLSADGGSSIRIESSTNAAARHRAVAAL